MFGSAALDVAIGLITLFLLLSTVCSATCEWLLSKLKPRSGMLRDAILTLFAQLPAGSAAKGSAPTAMNATVKFIMEHGLLRPPTGTFPSYISARSFAQSVIDGLIPDPPAGPGTPPAIAELRKQAESLPDSEAKTALLAIFDRVGNDLTAATKAIEAWYSDMMDRVSGVYKRHVQLVLFVCGLLLAIAINADTIMVARTLATDPQTRATVVAEAIKNAAKPAGSTAGKPLDQNVRDAQAALAHSALPLGWIADAADPRAYPWSVPPGTGLGGQVVAWIQKILGLLMTAAAVSFGAPFWFDLLNRVANLRASGPKPVPSSGAS